MRYGMLLGGGIAIYAIVALAWSAMQVYGFTEGLLPRLVEILVLLVSCLIAGSALKLRNWKDILPYSIGWAIVTALLDAIFVAPIQDWQLYASWSTWAWYALVIFLPLLSPLVRRQPVSGRAWET